jgi:hypothetical protein
MKFSCTLGFHNWAQNCEKCSRCGKTRPGSHAWSGCKCTKCETTRDEGHEWVGCKCSTCGRGRNQGHDWKNGRCARCGAKAPSLMRTVISGDPAELRRLIASGADVNEADPNGVTALMLAAMTGKAACIAVLIEAGARVNTTDGLGHSALRHAVTQGKNLESVKALIEGGADVNRALSHQGYFLSSGVAEIDLVIEAARQRVISSKQTVPPAKMVSRGAPAVLSDLMSRDNFFLPTGDGLVQSDEPTKEFSASVLSNYRGWLCAVCQVARCDETSSVLVKVSSRAADGKLELQPVAICENCMATHAEEELISMSKAGKLCNAVTVAN